MDLELELFPELLWKTITLVPYQSSRELEWLWILLLPIIPKNIIKIL